MDSVAFLTITFPGGTNVATMSFSSVEINGNWGSEGYVFVDPAVLPATTNEAPEGVITNAYASFDTQPNNTPTGSNTFYVVINRRVTNIVLMVEDITDVSQIVIDDLLVVGPPCPHRATAIATVTSGSVSGATLTDGGCGYTNAPLVLIQGGGGVGATATATVSNGSVVVVNITAGGAGYTNVPTVYIYSSIGLQVGLAKAVKPTFSDLLVGTNYQLQVSGDFTTWTNQGPPFEATEPTMVYPMYWDVDNWSQLFFRLQVIP